MRFVVLSSLLAIALPAAACEPALTGVDLHRIEGKDYVVVWRPEPATLSLGEFFAIEVAACARSSTALPTQLRVDAVMPEHKHGMNYRPTVVASGGGRFRADGLLFHMPGTWEVRLDVRGAAGAEVVSERLVVR